MAAQSVIHLTQSQYYSPQFNAAVFDGPIRIYFAQHQEALALKVYLRLQQYFKETYSTFRNTFKQHGQTIFLMLYPTSESFQSAFSATVPSTHVLSARLGEDHVLGVCGPLHDDQYERIFEQVKAILKDLSLSEELPAPSV